MDQFLKLRHLEWNLSPTTLPRSGLPVYPGTLVNGSLSGNLSSEQEEYWIKIEDNPDIRYVVKK